MSSDASPPIRHLNTVYSLACVLVGPDGADSLVRQVYQRAAHTPPSERPDDIQGWLIGLLADTHNDREERSMRKTALSNDEISLPPDPLREEVARETVERALPIALSACSLQDRFFVMLDVLEIPEKSVAQQIEMDTSRGEQPQEEAWNALWTGLGDVLSDSERTLVETTLSQTTVRDILRDVLEDRFPALPSSVQTAVKTEIREAQRKRASASQAQNDSSAPASGPLSVFRNVVASRRLRRAVGLLLLAAAAALGLLYLESSSSPAPSSLIERTLAAADTVQPAFASSDFAAVESHLQTSWDRRLSVPPIENASLQGAGPFHLGPSTAVPVLLYTDEQEQERIATFAFNYAALDRLPDRVRFPSSLRTALAEEKQLITQSESNRNAIVWRQRDDIFVSVAPHLSTDTLRERITP